VNQRQSQCEIAGVSDVTHYLLTNQINVWSPISEWSCGSFAYSSNLTF